MKIVELGNYTKIRTGKLDANASSPDGQYPFFTCAIEPLSISSYSYDCECVLVAGNGDLNVKYHKGKFDAYQRTYIIESQDNTKLDVRYCYHFLSRYIGKLRSLSIGGVIKYIKLGNLTEAKIPLPPLAEQKRIAAILDKADAIRRKRQQALDLTDTFLRSTFLHMFGDPVTNPMGWDVKPLGEVTLIDAPMVDPRKPQYQDLLHYGPDRITKETGQLLPAKTAKEDGLNSGKFLCNTNHVLYSKIRPYLNKVALVEQECLCSADVYPVGAVQGETTLEFLLFMLRSQAFLDYVQSCPSRANIPKLNRKEFAAYQTVVPDYDLQLEFAKIVKKSKATLGRSQDQFTHSKNLFSALQQKAFKGEL